MGGTQRRWLVKRSKTLVVLVAVISLLALFAAAAGVFWQGGGEPFPFTTLRGETVSIQGKGLYRFDTVSMAAQAIAADAVTLCVGIPLLLVSVLLYRRGSLRGALLLAGTLGYFLYTYASMSFTDAFNPFFLVYVALFSLSLFAFVLSLMCIKVDELPDRFAERLPRRAISGLLFAIGGFLLLAWLGRIAPALLEGTPPFGLESYATLVIQAMDLALIVPLAFLSGVLLLRRRAYGYLLAAVALTKGFTMGTAVAAMALGQVLAGVAVSPVELVVFPGMALAFVAMTYLLLRNVVEGRPSAQETRGALRQAGSMAGAH
jgi:hypothetical protein